MIWLLVSTAYGYVACNALQDPCSEDLAEVLESLEQDVLDEPEISQPYMGMPAGNLSAEELKQAWEHIHAQGSGILGLFAELADGQERFLPGAVVQELIERSGADIGLLPLDYLVEVYSDGSVMDFFFDFGGETSFTTKTPDEIIYYLRDGVLQSAVQPGRKIKVKDTVQILISPNGIEGVRRGDLRISGFKVDLRTEYRPGRVLTHEGYPVVEADLLGDPVKDEDGTYQVQTFDDWIVVDPPFLSDVWIGIPTI